jgi:hypothetical protein
MSLLKQSGEYHSRIWGELPPAFPTDPAERTYRYLLERMPADSLTRILMGEGFKGVAYRFRAALEYETEFRLSFEAPGGVAPPTDEHYAQERALFGFFVSGLACIECFWFAIHAIGAFYESKVFRLDPRSLKNLTLKHLADGLTRTWPDSEVATAVQALISDEVFRNWKDIRNILSHRAIPARLITVTPADETQSTWQLVRSQGLGQDEPLALATVARREWLEARVRELWHSVEQSFPPR